MESVIPDIRAELTELYPAACRGCARVRSEVALLALAAERTVLPLEAIMGCAADSADNIALLCQADEPAQPGDRQFWQCKYGRTVELGQA